MLVRRSQGYMFITYYNSPIIQIIEKVICVWQDIHSVHVIIKLLPNVNLISVKLYFSCVAEILFSSKNLLFEESDLVD